MTVDDLRKVGMSAFASEMRTWEKTNQDRYDVYHFGDCKHVVEAVVRNVIHAMCMSCEVALMEGK